MRKRSIFDFLNKETMEKHIQKEVSQDNLSKINWFSGKVPAIMTESVRAGPNFRVISCLCLWTARWSSLVNLCIKLTQKKNEIRKSGSGRRGREEKREEESEVGKVEIMKQITGSGRERICLGKWLCGPRTSPY